MRSVGGSAGGGGDFPVRRFRRRVGAPLPYPVDPGGAGPPRLAGPWGTFAVNVTGSLTDGGIGVLGVRRSRREGLEVDWQVWDLARSLWPFARGATGSTIRRWWKTVGEFVTCPFCLGKWIAMWLLSRSSLSTIELCIGCQAALGRFLPGEPVQDAGPSRL